MKILRSCHDLENMVHQDKVSLCLIKGGRGEEGDSNKMYQCIRGKLSRFLKMGGGVFS